MFISSSGGHLEQLLSLKETMKQHEHFIITEKNLSTIKLKEEYNHLYFIPFFSRKQKWLFPFIFMLVFFKSISIFIKVSPDIIVTTGAGGVIPMCIIGKLMKKKIIFIETFSRIDSTTITGKICYKFADVFIIQWESLQRFYPNAKYLGSIY